MFSFQKQFHFLTTSALAILLAVSMSSCDLVSSDDDGDDKLSPPVTYEFKRDGESTVAYPGQMDRRKMVAEMTAYVSEADAGNEISEQTLIDMYTNAGGNGGGHFSFSSDRQLSNKVFPPKADNNFYRDIFARAAAASKKDTTASNGQAGLLEREQSGGTILVSKKGHEFTQLVEKGLMGSVFYHQVFNVYLTDGKIGPQVENEELVEGENYTAREHHFDEAFGYFGAPQDWLENSEASGKFWAGYASEMGGVSSSDKLSASTIMDAYIKGRTAIVNENEQVLDEQVSTLYEHLELLTAATAVHYINSTISQLSNGNQGEAFHALSEGWAFVNAIKYSPNRKLSTDQINTILNTHFGENGNFWEATPSGLRDAKALIVDNYPALEPVKDDL